MAIFLPLPGNESLAAELARSTRGSLGEVEVRRFPDQERLVRIRAAVSGAPVALVCTLARPDDQALPLLFAARTARDLGAASVILIAPYLCYLRQDRVFEPGQGLTSRYFADFLSGAVDGLVTVDPHLHRYRGLAELYGIPTQVVHAAPLLAKWISENVERPLVIGPDAESEQWVEAIARLAGAPHAVFAKARLGDRDVRLNLPSIARWRGFNPVLVDDIISSGETLYAAASALVDAGFDRPACLAVHALFDERAAARLARVTTVLATTDTIGHPSNRFAVAPLIAAHLLAEPGGTDRMGLSAGDVRPG